MAHSFVWEKLSEADCEALENIVDITEVKNYLKPLLQKGSDPWLLPEGDPYNVERNEILLDFLFHILRFCKGQFFTSEKTSAFFSLMYHTHKESMENHAGMEEAYRTFEGYVVEHSVSRPPFAVQVFHPGDIQAMHAWIQDTYFRHYNLYRYAFTTRVEITLQSHHGADNVQKPRVPKPLSLGIPEEEWLKQDGSKRRPGQQGDGAPAAQNGEAKGDGEGAEAGEESNEPVNTTIDAVRTAMLGGPVATRLAEMEAKVSVLESQVAQSQQQQQPPAKGKK